MNKETLNSETVFAIARTYMNTAPVDVFSLIKHCGIKLRFTPLPDELSGYIEALKGGGFAIGVNSFHPRSRQRFTAAHELGHYAYHLDLIGEGIDDTRAYRSEPGGKFFNRKIGAKQETEANRFASNLLMPQALIKKLEKKGVRSIPDLAKRLDVSRQAMSIRMGSNLTLGLEEPEADELTGILQF